MKRKKFQVDQAAAPSNKTIDCTITARARKLLNSAFFNESKKQNSNKLLKEKKI